MLASWDDLPMADREALFYFAGGGLFVTGDVLGRTAVFEWAETRVTLALPTVDHISEGDRWGLEAHKVTWREGDGKPAEIFTATVGTFELRIEVSEGVDDQAAVQDAFPVAVEIAEAFLATARTLGGQYWIPSAHEAPQLNGYGSLVVSGTYDEVDERARWHPAITLVSFGDESAIGPDLIERILSATHTGKGPAVAEVLLADARATVAGPTVSQDWMGDRRDTARVVLLAAVACEVKIKATVLAKSPAQFNDLLDVILESPRDVSIAAGQLVDKPMKAALGVSLRDANKPLYKAVSNDLFPRRNRVAHGGYEPSSGEAREAVKTATYLFAWLDALPSKAAGPPEDAHDAEATGS
jgi:hypothetical protein